MRITKECATVPSLDPVPERDPEPNHRPSDDRAKRSFQFPIKVCHLTPLQNRADERAFTRQSLPGIPYGLRPVIVGPHKVRAQVDGVGFEATSASRNRLLRILTGIRMTRTAVAQRADIYHVHSPELIPVALILKLLYRKTVVYDTREDFPSMMLTKTYIPARYRTLVSKAVAAIERFAAQNLDGVITADPGSLRPLARVGPSKKLVYYNFPNLRFFPSTSSAEKKYDVVYRGGLSERAGTFVLLRAIKLLADSGLHARLLMFGYTDNQATTNSIQGTLKDLGISQLVTLGGVIPHAQMGATLSSAQILVCPLLRIPKFENNIPVKVFEAWACGLAVVASDLPPIRSFLSNRGYGILVPPGDPAELAQAIRSLLTRPELREECGRRAREAVVDRYNSSTQISRLLAFYRRVLPC